MGVPSLPIRNFSKFQAMSVLLTGFQIKKWGLKHFWGQSQDEGFAYLAIRLSESSEGAGSDFLRNVKRGCSFSPFTSTCPNKDDFSKKKEKVFGSANINFRTKKIQNGKEQNRRIRSTLSNMSPLNSKPLPGLTCFKRLTISSPPPFSCSASALIKLIVNQSSCGQQPSEQNNVVELILEGKGLVSINPCHEI